MPLTGSGPATWWWRTATAWSWVPRERAEEVAKAALPFLDNVTRERYIKATGHNPWAKGGT